MTQNRMWNWLPPMEGRQVEGTSLLPFGRYEMPDGSERVSFGLPQPMLDAYRALGYAGGIEQDPNAPPGYVTTEAIRRGGMGLAESAMVGALAAQGAARSMPTRALDASQAARMKRAAEVGFELTPQYTGLKGAYEPERLGTRWFAADPSVASTYADGVDTPNQVIQAFIRPGNQIEIDAGGNWWNKIPSEAVPENLRGRGLYENTNDIMHRVNLRSGDVDTVRFRNIIDPGQPTNNGTITDVTAVVNPANIRSVNAMFDPAKADSANLLAADPMAGAVPLMFDDPNRPRQNRMIMY